MKILRGSEGLTLFMVLFVMAFFLLFVTGGLFFSQLNLKAASNLKLATQAVEVADAGLHHGLAVLPWVWDFDSQLNCGTPPCTLISQTSFAPMTGFTYTVTTKNNPTESVATDDTDSIVLVTSQADGPSSTKKIVEAYVRRSVASFTPPAALYINAASSSPAIGSYYFDDDDSIKIKGNDTTPNNLTNQTDDTTGLKPTIYGIATTSATVTTALTNEYTGSWLVRHDVVGTGSEPSIATVGDVLDIDTIALNFFNAAPAGNKFLNGLHIKKDQCPSQITQAPPNPISCVDYGSTADVTLGTNNSPQITYIKDDGTSGGDIDLDGNVTGYGVLILEGRATIRESFRFYGLVVHKRSTSSHYFAAEENSWFYGGVLLGSFDEGDGKGKKVRFRVEDFSRIFYSSEALAMVDANWGSLLPKPPRVFAWLDK